MSESKKPELLPCPFCFSPAEQKENIDDSSVTYYVECTNCKNSTGIYGTKEESIKAWNLRVPAAPQWTTEPPNASGMYLAYIPMCGLCAHDIYFDGAGTGHIGKGTLAEFVKDNTNVLWCTVHVPPLPEGKESK